MNKFFFYAIGILFLLLIPSVFANESQLNVDVAFVIDYSSGSFNQHRSTMCNNIENFIQTMNAQDYNLKVTVYGLGGEYCYELPSETSKSLFKTMWEGANYNYPVFQALEAWALGTGYLINHNGQGHQWREDADAKIVFVGTDSAPRGAPQFEHSTDQELIERIISEASENNVYVNIIHSENWEYGCGTYCYDYAEQVTNSLNTVMVNFLDSNILHIVEETIPQQIQYFPSDLNDVGECQRGIRRLLPDNNWEILREPVFSSQEFCSTNKDEDCDGVIDNVDSCVGIVDLFVDRESIFVGEINSVSVDFRGTGENVVCSDSLSGQVLEKIVGSNTEEFVFSLSGFDEGLHQGAVECSFDGNNFSKPYYFEVESRGDIGVKALKIENNNPAVGEIVSARVLIENYSNVAFSNVDLDFFVSDDLFGSKKIVSSDSSVLVSLGPMEIKVVEFDFSYGGEGWIEVSAVLDKEEKIVFDSRDNKSSNRIVYVGLADPNLVSGGIVLDAVVSPEERPLSGVGFNFSGSGEYLINNSLILDVAGALIEVFVEGPDSGYFYTHTNNNGEFNLYVPNPDVLGDYNAIVRITDGTYEDFVYLDFSVIEPEESDENCYVPCVNCGGGSGGGGSGGWGGSGGSGGWGGGITYPGCVGPDLFGIIDFVPNPPFILEEAIDFNTSFWIKNLVSLEPYDFNIQLFKNDVLVKEIRVEDYTGGLLKVYERSDVALSSDKFSMIIDVYNEVVECSKSNNVVVARTIVEPRFSDVSIDDIIIPHETIEQESNVFRVKVSNRGNVVARDVNVLLDNGEGFIDSKILDTLLPGKTVFLSFNVQFSSVGKKLLTASTSYVDGDRSNNSFSREFVVYSHDFFITSVDSGDKINLVFSNNNPSIGEEIQVDALYKCSNPQIKGVVPITLFVNGIQKETKNFDFDCSKDNIARFDFTPQESMVYVMGVYVNYSNRVFEQNLENNYATRALIVNEPQSWILNNKDVELEIDYLIELESNQNGDWVFAKKILENTINLQSNQKYFLTDIFNQTKTMIPVVGEYRLKLTLMSDGFAPQIEYSNKFIVDYSNIPPEPPTDCFDSSLDPIPICTLSDLDRVREKLSGNYILMNDIDASETINWNDGLGWKPIGDQSIQFRGVLNGNNKKISNLFINRPSTTEGIYVGLFGYILDGKVYDLGLIDSNIVGYTHVGGVVGVNYKSTIENTYNTGAITSLGPYVGGIAGNNEFGTIIKSYNNGVINSTAFFVGGIVGNNSNGIITNSYNTGPINNMSQYTGGIAGDNSSATISNSYNIGAINSLDDFIGGIVGRNNSYSKIINSYNTGIINSSTGYTVGGIAGYNHGEIENTYNMGTINGGYYTGGIIGYIQDGEYGKLKNSYNIGLVNATSVFGGAIGMIGDNVDIAIQNIYWDLATSQSNCYQDNNSYDSNNYCVFTQNISDYYGENGIPFKSEGLNWSTDVWQANENKNPTLK